MASHPTAFSLLKASLLALLAASLCGRACQADEAKRRFDIPAGNAGERLNQLFTDLGLSLVCDFEATGFVTTNAVHGVYTLKEALEKMAQGKNIQFWFPTERSVSCGRRPAPTQEATVKPPERARAVLRESAMLPEVTVTGTHIRNASPVGVQHIVFDGVDIDRSGSATLPDFLRTLPQNFEGGPTEDTQFIGRETQTNSARGTALNIRGLGPGETLVLLNGRRIAPGGTEGAFVDISNIPLSAVERIDVLPDSGSALYGTDAIGGIVNITLKRDYQGAETDARFGATSDRVLDEYRFSQTLGRHWDGGNGLLAFEYYRRGDLPARDRPQAQSDLTRFGGDNFDTRQSNPGTIFAGGTSWAIPSGQDGTGLKPADFSPGTLNLENQQLGADVLPTQERWNLLASGHHSLNDRIELFSDALVTRRDVNLKSPAVRLDLPVTPANPFYVNPTGGSEPIFVSYDFIDDLGPRVADIELRTLNIAAGARIDAGSKWRVIPYVSDSREEQDIRQSGQLSVQALLPALMDPNPTTAFNPFGDGSHTNPATLASLRSESFFHSNSDIRTVDVTADGPLLALPAGDLKFALGASQRRETFDSNSKSAEFGFHADGSPSRNVKALFGEVFVPLAGADHQLRGLQELELSLALRIEDYTDVGSATAPKLGVRWSPVDGLSLRGTWTQSFRAPNLVDLFEGNNGSIIIPLTDDTSPAGFTSALIWFGKNSDLRPERAHSWTFGAEIAPPWMEDWSLAITYFDIQIENGFEDHTFADNLLEDPRLASLVIRDPTAVQREIVCRRSTFSGFPGECLNAPVGALIDLRLGNNATTATNGFDLIAHHKFDTALGHFELGLNGTYALHYIEAVTAESPRIDLIDTQNNPLRLRTRGSVAWSRDGLSSAVFVNHDGAYRDVASTPRRSVGSWTTFDLQLRYDVARQSHGWLGDTHFFLNAQNLFDRDPPFLNNHLGIGYDAENADLMGRFLSAQIRKNW